MDEDILDARGLFEKTFGRLNKNVARSSLEAESEVYNMKHKNRGVCLIFNQKHFEPHTALNSRGGTDEDADRLYNRFRELDFEVILHRDLTASQILDQITIAGKRDFTQDDCFVCCILSHGEEGVIYGKDGKVAVEMILSPFRGDVCVTLAGKPKLFFIQACQGDKLDHGVQIRHGERVVADAVFKIPTHADFLVAYSTVPGFYSWRNTTNGSWFIQGLCMVLQRYGCTHDLLSLLLIVNRYVSYGFESNTPGDPGMDKKKQVPHITFTLTRKVLFEPKF